MTNHISFIAKKLLISNIFFRAGNIITKIFVNIYILKSTWDLRIVAGFSLMLLFFHLFSYTLFSWLVKYGYKNISHIFSIFGTVTIYLFFVFFPEQIGEYALYIGWVIWFFSGIYWCVFNNHQFDLTLPKNRGNFEWLKKSLRTVVTLIVPILAGSIITLNYLWFGYQSVFLLGALFYFISWVLGIVNIDVTSTSGFTPMKLLREMNVHKDIWKYIIMLFLISFALSLPLIEVIFPLIFYTRWIEELWIGLFVSGISIISIFASYIFGKFVHYKYYKRSFITSGLIYFIFIALLVVHPTELMFAVFVSSVTFLYVFCDIPLSVFTSNVFHEIKDYNEYKEEYILLREISVIFWRMLVFVIIFFLGSLGDTSIQFIFWAMWAMMLLAIALFYSTNLSHE